ncbi:hypothetical protein [Hymenobacter crusticola]|uniref:hypothetical protein n=1 Tax=Hymenobacter crusticola TaxID=1770526 RepID=UPI001C5009D1|nr:hypothetical protein [Hymenobacter crusticola]
MAALTQLGYFQFAAVEHLDVLQQEMATSYDTARVLTSLYEEATNAPYCFRLYDCDGEDLFEVGGLVDQLAAIQPTFDQLGVPLTWSDDHWSLDQQRHTIVLNGKPYTAFEGDLNSPRSWALATKLFVEMVNDQLALHRSSERVYPLLGGNDGCLVFLTPPLYELIRHHFDADEGPKEIGLWWQELG